MTTRYTNDEWTTLVRHTEKSLRVNEAPCPYVPVYTAGFAQYFDHTVLKVDTTPQQIDKLCGEARMHGFKVCIDDCIQCSTLFMLLAEISSLAQIDLTDVVFILYS